MAFVYVLSRTDAGEILTAADLELLSLSTIFSFLILSIIVLIDIRLFSRQKPARLSLPFVLLDNVLKITEFICLQLYNIGITFSGKRCILFEAPMEYFVPWNGALLFTAWNMIVATIWHVFYYLIVPINLTCVVERLMVTLYYRRYETMRPWPIFVFLSGTTARNR
ncbi:unnamed protein product, partial [Mesorhabditis spiculigera]